MDCGSNENSQVENEKFPFSLVSLQTFHPSYILLDTIRDKIFLTQLHTELIISGQRN